MWKHFYLGPELIQSILLNGLSQLSCFPPSLPPSLLCSFAEEQELLYVVVENLVVNRISSRVYQRLTF